MVPVGAASTIVDKASVISAASISRWARLTGLDSGHTPVMDCIDGVWRGDGLDDDEDPVRALWAMTTDARRRVEHARES